MPGRIPKAPPLPSLRNEATESQGRIEGKSKFNGRGFTLSAAEQAFVSLVGRQAKNKRHGVSNKHPTIQLKTKHDTLSQALKHVAKNSLPMPQFSAPQSPIEQILRLDKVHQRQLKHKHYGQDSEYDRWNRLAKLGIQQPEPSPTSLSELLSTLEKSLGEEKQKVIISFIPALGPCQKQDNSDQKAVADASWQGLHHNQAEVESNYIQLRGLKLATIAEVSQPITATGFYSIGFVSSKQEGHAIAAFISEDREGNSCYKVFDPSYGEFSFSTSTQLNDFIQKLQVKHYSELEEVEIKHYI